MKTEIKIQGLSKNQIKSLSSIAKERGFKSRNDLLLNIIEEFLKEDSLAPSADLYTVYLKEMIETEKLLLEKLNQKEKTLQDFEDRINRMNMLTARWLDYNEF
ncbi:hypothetical protein [Enterococcus diestrammenae]|uniref:Ribbon-helix-helix protein CopG domain-containing protein n=1 Tax=Enterococcus diestrammenae TaxID=1155073 RepID=A0ABV0F4N9_9ENTE|nr:hypothetical protein [Enterococcus diestrammenae]KAF1300068.1 hypothetical protein BAU18_08395 [Enterococcus diestrammenae]